MKSYLHSKEEVLQLRLRNALKLDFYLSAKMAVRGDGDRGSIFLDNYISKAWLPSLEKDIPRL